MKIRTTRKTSLFSWLQFTPAIMYQLLKNKVLYWTYSRHLADPEQPRMEWMKRQFKGMLGDMTVFASTTVALISSDLFFEALTCCSLFLLFTFYLRNKEPCFWGGRKKNNVHFHFGSVSTLKDKLLIHFWSAVWQSHIHCYVKNIDLSRWLCHSY